jgi:hypothetical protein
VRELQGGRKLEEGSWKKGVEGRELKEGSLGREEGRKEERKLEEGMELKEGS